MSEAITDTDSDEWILITDEQLDTTNHILDTIIYEMIKAGEDDDVKPEKKNVRVTAYANTLIKNINETYKRKGKYKVTTCLLFIGGNAFDRELGIDTEALHEKILANSDAEVDSFTNDDVKVIDVIIRENKYGIPAKVLDMEYVKRMKRHDESKSLSYVNIGFIQDKFAFFDMLGFNDRQAATLLILMGIKELPYYIQNKRGFIDTYKRVVKPTIEQLKKLDIDI